MTHHSEDVAGTAAYPAVGDPVAASVVADPAVAAVVAEPASVVADPAGTVAPPPLAAVADAAVVPLAAVPDEARLLREVEVVVPDGVVPGFLDAAGVAEPDAVVAPAVVLYPADSAKGLSAVVLLPEVLPVVDATLVYAAAVPPEVVPDAAPPLREVEVVVPDGVAPGASVLDAAGIAAVVVVPYGVVPAAGVVAVLFPLPPPLLLLPPTPLLHRLQPTPPSTPKSVSAMQDRVQ